MAANFVPHGNMTENLGTENKRWGTIFADYLNINNMSGGIIDIIRETKVDNATLADTATKAIYDSAGNEISTVFAKKSEVPDTDALVGKKAPIMTPLVNWNIITRNVGSTATGMYGWNGAGATGIPLTQSYKDFDRLMFVFVIAQNYTQTNCWILDTWQFDFMMENYKSVSITEGVGAHYWWIYGKNQIGTSQVELSREDYLVTQTRYTYGYINEIYGLTY